VVSIAATSPEIAVEAARLVTVDYEPLPSVVDLQTARHPSAPQVFPGAAGKMASPGVLRSEDCVPQGGNVRSLPFSERGNIEQGFADADVIVEAHYSNQVQTHSAFESHGTVADWRPDQLVFYSSTQSAASVRQDAAAFFHLPLSQVRAIAEFVGGAVGKIGADNAGVCAAALSKKSGTPVSLTLDREEEHLSGGNRASSTQVLRIGAKRDGSLTAIHHVSYRTAGCATNAGDDVPATHMYTTANLRSEENDVFTNAGPALDSSAAGFVQRNFALEQTIDELAHKLALDPLDLRDKIDANQLRKIERQIIRKSVLWQSRVVSSAPTHTTIKRGIGFAQSMGAHTEKPRVAAEVRIYRDGSVEVLSAVQDLGGGIKTALAKLVAEEYGIELTRIGVRIGDTNFPSGPLSSGDTIEALSPAVRNAAWQAKCKFLADIAPALGARAADLQITNGKVHSISDKLQPVTFADAAAMMTTDTIAAQAQRQSDYAPTAATASGNVVVAEIHVDVEIGLIRVQRVSVVLNCGRPINPNRIKARASGSVLQGISYALYESRHLDPGTGLMVNPDLEMYKIAGSRESPEITIDLVESYPGQTSTDARSIGGTDCMMAVAPAIGNAFFNATGFRIRQTPFVPSQVLAVLSSLRNGATTA
jgi:xanthine dehydrogenase YagR molybdenum-binding subunit